MAVIDFNKKHALDGDEVLLTALVKLNPTPFTQALQKEKVNDYLLQKRKANKLHKRELALKGNSLGLFSPRNRFRIWLTKIVISRKFDTFIHFIIFVSCVALVLDKPTLEDGSALKAVLFYLDLVITTLFIIEMLAKIISSGFYFPKGSYLSDSWNVLDGTIVFISILNLSLSGGLSYLKAIRALRAFRALRVITHAKSMKLVVSSLARALPALSNVCLIVGMSFLIFAIMGNQFFSGQFAYCQPFPEDRYSLNQDECIGGKLNENDEFVNRVWRNPPYNFDNFGSAFLTVFEVCSLEGWTEVMYTAMDITGRGLHPIKNNAWYSAFYFAFLIMIGSVFLFSLIVSVIIVKYLEMKTESDGQSFLTAGQRSWVVTQKLVIFSRPFRVSESPTGRFMRLRMPFF